MDFSLTAQPSIREKVWRGSLPCRIHLNPGESRVFDACDPFYIQLPRISYLPVYLPAMYEYFREYLIDPAASVETAWLEFEGVPLKWHWPIGLLFDLLTNRDPTTPADDPDVRGSLPWTLTLHFSPDEYPEEHLLRMDRPGFMHDAFMNSAKEADLIRNGNAKVIMGLSEAESRGLWESVANLEYERFWGISEKLISSTAYPLRHIPVKLYLPTSSRVIMKLVSPMATSRDPQTVGRALNKMLPELFPTRQAQTMARPVLHGIVLPMQAPLLEVMREMIYPDGYLHIAIVMMT